MDECHLEVPRTLVAKFNGFSIDIGGSVVKMVYLDKEDMEDTSRKTVRLHMKSFSKEDLDGSLQYLHGKTWIRRNSGATSPPAILTTGVGGNEFVEKFNETFNVSVQTVPEFDAFILATEFLLMNYPEKEIFVPLSRRGLQEGVANGIKMTESFKETVEPLRSTVFKMDTDPGCLDRVLANYNKTTEMLEGEGVGLGDQPPAIKQPYIIAQLGSGFVFLKTTENGRYRSLDLTPFAGRSFLDLGRYLTGAKTHSELVELAARGNEDNLNTYLKDVTVDRPGDVYSLGSDEKFLIYGFGKLDPSKPDAVKKEDLARTLLQTICHNIMNLGHHVMHRENCQHMLLTGSFVNNDVTQELLVQGFEYSRYMHTVWNTANADAQLHILKHGGWLGALGSFLMQCEYQP